jgi:hypothetical protein
MKLLTTILTRVIITPKYIRAGEWYLIEYTRDMIAVYYNSRNGISSMNRVVDPHIKVFYYFCWRKPTITITIWASRDIGGFHNCTTLTMLTARIGNSTY